ncbi:hypothetical protein [Nocardioides sp. CF8]|uniref:hypothetical protein n=1 Tax=Nocardioides sp. CF8 TaxID=110319 RepID=UPI001E5A3F95|nr:hypothetical protein [Nocardioides sp. CF8]
MSASKATEPVMTTTAAWATAVTRSATKLIFTARMPSTLASSAGSTESATSWL